MGRCMSKLTVLVYYVESALQVTGSAGRLAGNHIQRAVSHMLRHAENVLGKHSENRGDEKEHHRHWQCQRYPALDHVVFQNRDSDHVASIKQAQRAYRQRHSRQQTQWSG